MFMVGERELYKRETESAGKAGIGQQFKVFTASLTMSGNACANRDVVASKIWRCQNDLVETLIVRFVANTIQDWD